MINQSHQPPLAKLNAIYPNGCTFTDVYKAKEKDSLGLMVLCANCSCPCTKIEAAGTLMSSHQSVCESPVPGTVAIGEALKLDGKHPGLSTPNHQITVVLSCEQCREWSAIVFTQDKGIIRLVSHVHVARFEEYSGHDEDEPLQCDIAGNYSGLLGAIHS